MARCSRGWGVGEGILDSACDSLQNLTNRLLLGVDGDQFLLNLLNI